MESASSAYRTNLIFQAVNENSISAVSSYTKDEILASLNQFNEQGETPLIVAMKKKHFVVISELMKVIRVIGVDCYGEFNPKCLQVIQELFSSEIPVVEAIDNMIDDLDCEWWLCFIANVLIQSNNSITRQDKISALEFVGASLILNLYHSNDASMLIGLKYWKEAMANRFSTADGELPIPKIPLCGQLGLSGKVLDSETEVMSVGEIEEWKKQLLYYVRRYDALGRNLSPLHQTLQIQALLVQQRICSEANPRLTSPYRQYLKSLLIYGCQSYNFGRYNHAINTYLLVLEQMAGFDPKMTHANTIEVFNETLRKLSSCFIKLLKKPLNSPEREELSPANILVAIKFCTTIAKFFPKPTRSCSNSRNHSSFVGHIYDFLLILDDVSLQMNSQDKKKLEEHISSYIRSSEKDTSTLLHAAIWPYHFNLKTINLFLELGVDPNAADMNGKTALHILALKLNWYSPISELYVQVFQTLVNAGGHLDMATPEGTTVISILKDNIRNSSDWHPYLDSVINGVLPLSCYCAQVIRQRGIPFNDGQLPPTLQEFVSCHSAKGPSSPSPTSCSK